MDVQFREPFLQKQKEEHVNGTSRGQRDRIVHYDRQSSSINN